METQDWSNLDSFRAAIEAEFYKSIVNKPERIPAYEETMREMREKMYKMGLDPADPRDAYAVSMTIKMVADFLSGFFNRLCGDPHVMGHLRDGVVCLGYHVRDIAFSCEAPEFKEAAE